MIPISKIMNNKNLSCKKIIKIISFTLRIAIILLLIASIVVRFLKNKSFDNNDMILICVIVVLVLADFFSSISIGNFLNLKKDVKEAKASSERNRNYFRNLFCETAKTVINFNFSIEKENIKDRKNANSERDADDSVSLNSFGSNNSRFRNIEKICFEKYCLENAMQYSDIEKTQKVTFSNSMLFYCDGHYKVGNLDTFLEIKSLDSALRNDSVIKKFASQLDTYNLQPDKKARLHLLVFTYEKPNKVEKKLAILKENLFTEIFSNALEIRTICLSD